MYISILIITKKYTESDTSIERAKLLHAEGVDFEVLLAEGDNPSLQRNELAKAAKGEYLLFLDNDSEPDERILTVYSTLIKKYPSVVIFGGPSLLKIEQTNFQVVLNFFFSSIFGIGPFKSRYNSIGPVRLTTERELILSNMMIKREYFINSGGFNGELYPGEENEFLNRNKQKQIIYTPEAKVYRFPRKSLGEFLMQMFSYGQGRAKHLGINVKDSIFLMPAFFSIYLAGSLLLSSLGTSQNYLQSFFPLLIYLLLITVASFAEFRFEIRRFLMSPFCFAMGHLAYGLGIWTGLCRYRLMKSFFPAQKKLSYLNVIRIKELKMIS